MKQQEQKQEESSKPVQQIRKHLSEYSRAPLTKQRMNELDHMADEDLKTIVITGGKSSRECRYAISVLIARGSYPTK